MSILNYRYRVFNFVGGRDLIDNERGSGSYTSDKLDANHPMGSFVIDCYHYGFNGRRYGPVHKTFKIRKFQGLREITTLEVFPLVCDPDSTVTRKGLLKRGEKFARFADPKTTIHQQYQGLTLDQSQEQVRSVDFLAIWVVS